MSDDIALLGTPTPILGLTKPAVGADIDVWGDLTNANWDILDKALLTTGGVMTGALQAFNGTLAAPGYAIGGANTGLYRSGTAVGMSLQGAAAWTWAPGGATAGLQLDMATHPLINLAAPVNNADAATKAYVDAHAWQEAPNNTTTYGRRAVAWAPVVPFSPRGSIVNGANEPANIVVGQTILSPFAEHTTVGFNIYWDGAAWRYLTNGYGKIESFDPTVGSLAWFGYANGTGGNVATAALLAALDAAGDFTVAGQLHCTGGDSGISASPAGSYLVLGGAPGPQVGGSFVLNGGGRPTYSHEWYYYVTRTMSLDVNGNLIIAGSASKPGGGTWADSSDARIKTVHGDYMHGLAELLQLHPVSYSFRGNEIIADRSLDGGDPLPVALSDADQITPAPRSPHYREAIEGTPFVGLVAQEVEGLMPELVTRIAGTIDGEAVDDMRVLDPSPLLFAIINAIKELSARLVALENIVGMT